MRRRSQATATIISREDLLFTDEEVRELFRTTLNIELKPEEIAEYRDANTRLDYGFAAYPPNR